MTENKNKETRIVDVAVANLPTEFGNFRAYSFLLDAESSGKEEVLVVLKLPLRNPVPVRIHSQCITGDVMHSMRCDCRSQLKYSLEYINEYGGMIIYLNQEGRGIGLFNKIKAYALQDKGLDTVEANICLGFPVDGRTYEAANAALEWMKEKYGIKEIMLITNNPNKIEQINSVKVAGVIHPESTVTKFNIKYIEAKIRKLGHRYDKRKLTERKKY